jgi:hypothetical protein
LTGAICAVRLNELLSGGGLKAGLVLGDQNQVLAIGGGLASQFKPDPAIGAGDQGES